MATVDLPTYVSISEAARRYHLGHEALTRLVEAGRVRAVEVDGDIAVAEEDVKNTEEYEIPSPTEDMKGRGIRAREAIEKYKIAAHSTLAGWRRRRIVDVITQEHKNVVYDEYSVAKAAQFYHAARHKRGVRYPKSGPN
ncbi:MAG: hypothetical protein PVI59_04800 [Anaerolineae bacterium]